MEPFNYNFIGAGRGNIYEKFNKLKEDIDVQLYDKGSVTNSKSISQNYETYVLPNNIVIKQVYPEGNIEGYVLILGNLIR